MSRADNPPSLDTSETAGKSNKELIADLVETCNDCGEMLPPGNPNVHSCDGEQESYPVRRRRERNAHPATPTAAERAALIDADDGDPDAIVLTTRGRQASAAYHKQHPEYDDETDCCTSARMGEWKQERRADVQQWGRYPCSHCFDVPTAREMRDQQCDDEQCDN